CIEQYNETPAAIESLKIIADSYEKLGMTDLAESAQQIYFANIPVTDIDSLVLEDQKPWYKFW
ncbi:MAG TPA: hypothetical protein QGH35_05210, partial [Gammaproteobacteria bacterium]|nr:hypothetical protein [Gammaproteobacteria bacterium]